MKLIKLKELIKIHLTTLLTLLLISVFSVTVTALENSEIIKNEKAQIDFTDSNNLGNVKINMLEKTDKRIKVTIEKGTAKYTYDLKNDTTPEIYPFQLGDGEYTVKVWINAAADRYTLALAGKYNVKLSNPLAPFINPSQYVNFTKDSKIAKKAEELIKDSKTELEKVEKIYEFVINSLVYDTDKANAAVQGQLNGYLPSVDAIVDSGKGICFDYAAVFAAMLRSQGIPSKLVTGYVKPNNAYHAWNEFYLKDAGGWFKINEMKFDGKKFERVDPTFDSTSKSNKKILQFIGDGSNYSKFLEY